MSNELNDKVTELAAGALKKPDSWVTVVILALWTWWMAYQLSVLTQKLQEEKLAASKVALDAMDAANAAKVKAIQLDIDASAASAEEAHQVHVLVLQRINGQLAEAEVTKARVANLKNWKELDALAQGN